MKNNTLIVSSGDTPQIITEFLFESIRKHKKNIYNKIIVITTTQGKDLIDEYLLKGNIIENLGSFFEIDDLYDDFSKTLDIILLKDVKGSDLADLRSNEDAHSEFLQYFKVVQSEKTKSKNNVTFLISGGRKSSSIALSQAAMLYGESEDQIVHVLAHSSKWNNKEWWFPDDITDETQAITVFNLPFIGLGGFIKGVDLSNPNNLTKMIQDKIDMVTPLSDIIVNHTKFSIEGAIYNFQPKAATIFRYFINNTISNSSSSHVSHNAMIDDFDDGIAEAYYACFERNNSYIEKFEKRIQDYKNMQNKMQIRDEKDQWLREARSILKKEIVSKVNDIRHAKLLEFVINPAGEKLFGLNLESTKIKISN